MKSIIQEDNTKCFICGGRGGEPLDKHHVFGGARRSKSEKYGLTVYLHHNTCHIFGALAVHQNAQVNRNIQRIAQKKAMEKYGWSEEDFRREFGKSYL